MIPRSHVGEEELLEGWRAPKAVEGSPAQAKRLADLHVLCPSRDQPGDLMMPRLDFGNGPEGRPRSPLSLVAWEGRNLRCAKFANSEDAYLRGARSRAAPELGIERGLGELWQGLGDRPIEQRKGVLGYAPWAGSKHSITSSVVWRAGSFPLAWRRAVQPAQ